MKVILLQDVAKIGRRHDVVTVADGYGLNKLIPQGLAEMATPANLRKVATKSAQNMALREAADSNFLEIVGTLEGKVIDVKVEANEDGKLYQALKLENIIKSVEEAEGVSLLPEMVVLKNPVKQLGEHSIHLVSGDKESILIINVIKI